MEFSCLFVYDPCIGNIIVRMRNTLAKRSKMRCACFVLAVLCLRLAGSEDLYWRPNTDWNNPSNWGLGRAPCEGDVADFSSVSSPWFSLRGSRVVPSSLTQVPRGSVIKLDTSTTVRSVILPLGSTIALGRSITLRLSNSTTCEGVQSPSFT